MKIHERLEHFRSILKSKIQRLQQEEQSLEEIQDLKHHEDKEKLVHDILRDFDMVFKPFEEAYNSTKNSEVMLNLQWFIENESWITKEFTGRTITIENLEITGSYANDQLARDIVSANRKTTKVLIQRIP